MKIVKIVKMKMRWTALAVAGVLWIPVRCLAQTDPPVPPIAAASPAAADPGAVIHHGAAEGSDAGETLPDRASQRWFEVREQLARGGDNLERKLSELRKLRQDVGARALPDPARALVVEGFRALDAGDTDGAESRFNSAIEIDPGSPDARLGLAAMERRRSAASPVFLSEVLHAARIRLTSLHSAPFAMGNWLIVGGVGLLASGMLALLALAFRHQVLFRHDAEEFLKQRMDPEVAAPLAWVALLLPLLLTFDLYWAVLYWVVILWAYFGNKERVVAAASVLFCAAALPAIGLSTRLLQGSGEPYAAAAVAYLDGVVDGPMLSRLDAYADKFPDDRDAQVLEALVAERNGRPREAIRIYRKLLEHGKSADVLNNVANVYYRLDEKDKAFEYWNKSLEADSGFAPAHYNLSIYYFDFFEFGKKEEQFAKAKELDPRLIDRWVREGSGVMNSGVSRERVKDRMWAAGNERDALKATLTAPHFLAAVAALIVGAILGGKRRSAGVANSCVKCGQAFCSECKPPSKERQDYCLQCVHLFLRKDGVSPQMRSEKMKHLSRHQSLSRGVSMLLSLVAPGTGLIYRRRTLSGFALVLLWALSLAAWSLGNRVMLEPGLLARAAAVIPWSWGLAVAGVAWVLGNGLNVVQKG